MPNYQEGKIYTIRCLTDDTLIYVGSTTQPLCERLAQHKRGSNYDMIKDRLLYSTINENWDNWFIRIHELYPCSCKKELNKKEGEVIRLIGNLNIVIAGRTQKEWREDNKEKVKEYKKRDYETNKEKRLTHQKIYNENNKENKAEYDKKYREDPKYREERLQKKRAYYQASKLNKGT
jgi:hypothetical protein